MVRMLFAAVSLGLLAVGCSGGEVRAGDPFSSSPASEPANCLPCTTPSSASPTASTRAAERLSDASNPAPMQGSGSLPPPPIALDGRPGTGLGLPTGLLVPSKTDVNHQLDPKMVALLAQLVESLKVNGLPKVEVPITPTLPPETSRSLSSMGDRLSLLASVGTAVLSIFGLGRLGQWVVPVVTGLQSFFVARAQAQGTISINGASPYPANRSSAASPAAPSSTPPPGI